MAVSLIALVFGFTFTVVAMAVYVAGQYAGKSRQAAGGAAPAEDDPGASLLKNDQLSSISIWHSLLTRFDFVEIMRVHIAQAELRWSPGRLTLSMLLCGAVAFAVLSKVKGIPLWAILGAVWLTALTPYVYVLRIRSRRFLAFSAELPDALDSLARAMKTGYPLTSALDIVARETSAPVSAEFRRTHSEVLLGIAVPRALENLCQRVPLPEVDLFAAAIQLHSRTGGRLTEVLGVLAENMREQVALQGEVRAMAAQGKVTGIVLTALPFFIALMLVVVSPSYIGALLDHPYGKNLIAAAIFCLIAAHFIIRRIVDIRL